MDDNIPSTHSLSCRFSLSVEGVWHCLASTLSKKIKNIIKNWESEVLILSAISCLNNIKTARCSTAMLLQNTSNFKNWNLFSWTPGVKNVPVLAKNQSSHLSYKSNQKSIVHQAIRVTLDQEHVLNTSSPSFLKNCTISWKQIFLMVTIQLSLIPIILNIPTLFQ